MKFVILQPPIIVFVHVVFKGSSIYYAYTHASITDTCTVLHVRMEKIISIFKTRAFGKGCQSLHIIHVMRTPKMLISYVKLDRTLYSISYSMSEVDGV